MQLRAVPFDHPDAVALSARVQAEYAARYGDDGDVTPLRRAHFDPPHGLFLVAHDTEGTPVACGGWRAKDADDEGYADGDAEIKRMYVVPEARGRGLARRVLAALEDDARAAGRTRMVLETGTPLCEALSLYVTSGYVRTANFGPYRDTTESRCFEKPLTARVPTETS